MDWRDIAAIVFVCTAVNHLGLIGKIEEMWRKLPILDCPKCLTCWSVLAYGIATAPVESVSGILAELPRLFAISLLSSYIAIWLELLMFEIDTLYNIIYGAIENNNKENRDEDGSESE